MSKEFEDEFEQTIADFEAASEKAASEKSLGDPTRKPGEKFKGQSNGPGASINAPAGQWVDVPKGYTVAPGTYVDDQGVLRQGGDKQRPGYGSCVVWHLKGCVKKGILAEDIVYDVNNAPWCPDCYMDREFEKERQKIRGIFSADHGAKSPEAN